MTGAGFSSILSMSGAGLITKESIKNGSKHGVSLIELIVATGLFGTVLVSLTLIMNAAYHDYWTASGSLEVQKAALTGTRLLAKDLTLSNMDTVEIFDDPTVPPLDGIVFTIPADLNGDRKYDQTGKIIWQSYIGYYVTTTDGVSSLLRNRAAVTTPAIEPPVPSVDGVTPATIGGGGHRELVMRGVDKLDFELLEDVVKVELTGIFQERGTFSITVRNQIFPRN